MNHLCHKNNKSTNKTITNRGQHRIIIDMPIHYLHVYMSVQLYTFITLWPSVCCIFFLFCNCFLFVLVQVLAEFCLRSQEGIIYWLCRCKGSIAGRKSWLSEAEHIQMLFKSMKLAYCQQLKCQPLHTAVFCLCGIGFPVLGLLLVGCKMHCSCSSSYNRFKLAAWRWWHWSCWLVCQTCIPQVHIYSLGVLYGWLSHL